MERPLKTEYDDEFQKYKECKRFKSHKRKCHFYFDKIWNEIKLMTRNELYIWLSGKLNISEENAHFSKLNTIQCIEAIYFCQQLLNDNRRIDLDFGLEPITPFYYI